MRAKDALGRYGEDAAVRHLVAAGYDVLARNWRCAAGEIDIVARDGRSLVICEVKTRSSTQPAVGLELRFDVVSVLRPRSGPTSVSLVRGAF